MEKGIGELVSGFTAQTNVGGQGPKGRGRAETGGSKAILPDN